MNVFERCDIRSGTAYLVGIGFLGAVLTELSVQAGARVIAISRRDYALNVARAMGSVGVTFARRDYQEIIADGNTAGELTRGARSLNYRGVPPGWGSET